MKWLFNKLRRQKVKTYWVVVERENALKFTLYVKAVNRLEAMDKAEALLEEGFKIVDLGLE